MAGLLKRVLTTGIRQLSILQKQNMSVPAGRNFTNIFRKFSTTAPLPYEVVDPYEERKITQEVTKKVNDLVSTNKHGRLFAVVHVAGKQFKITEGDIIVVEGYWPPDNGDKISLDKVLLVGAQEFTLIGRPIVQQNLVRVEATVIEKTLSHTKTHFRKKRRKQYKRIHFYRIQQTMLRINSINILGEVNNPPDVSTVQNRIL